MDKPNINVLLVEDSPTDVLLLEAALEQSISITFTVTTVEQLCQGLACLDAQPFDVVLLDLGLPDSRGLVTFTRLHAHAPSLPVVVLSGMHDEDLAAVAVRAGAQDYLIKGQTGSELLVRAVRYAIERNQFQDQLCASERYFRALIEHSSDGIATLNADGSIRYQSPSALRMLGYSRGDLVGRNAFEFLHPDDSAICGAAFQQLLHQPQQVFTAELRYRREDGSWCWLETTGTNLLDIPGVEAIVVNYRDVTARKQAEAALRHANETLEQRIAERTSDLRQANADLARAARIKDEFLANMSHELRTPLNAILGRTQLLREQVYGALDSRQTEALQSIETSGQHLLALLNDILELAQVDSGQLEVQIKPITVAHTCQQSLHIIEQQAVHKRLVINLSLDPQVKTIDADERRLMQILINLLSNAIQFTPEGGSIGLEVRGDQEHQAATFTVWDTGIGIAEGDLVRLFHPFTQIDSRIRPHGEGSGLGLVLVQRLVQAHHGSVRVTSSLGQGSRFSVSMPWNAVSLAASNGSPASTSAHPSAAASAAASAHALGDRATRPRILVVEDNQDQIEVLQDYLFSYGYQVSVALNGGDALMLASESPPALVLMDIQLPGMDGLSVIRRMRQIPPLRDVPIIALTALALPGDRERCLAAGANVYLAKPVSLSILLREIQASLSRSMSQAASLGWGNVSCEE